jgi:ADP-ribosylglycohydrolase
MYDLTDRAFGCLAGGVIGDAMGTPTENLEPDEIEKRYGWVDDFEGDGTDDSIMKCLLADALIRTDGYANADDWAAEWVRNHGQIFGTKVGRFFQSVLHTAEKLRFGYLPREASRGNMPSSSSAMAIAPVGIVNAGNPRAAAAQAQEIASLIHIAEVAFCQDGAAAIAAATAEACREDATVDSVVDASTRYLKSWSGRDMIDRITSAVALAREKDDFKSFRTEYHRRFRQSIPCDSRETVPATIALTWLAHGAPDKVVAYGTNFGRDTDTIASMAGAICGALSGRSGFRNEWIAKLARGSARDQDELAKALVATATKKRALEYASWSSP